MSSKFDKVFGTVANAAISNSSAISSGLRISDPLRKPDEKETRLGNLAESVKGYMVNQSRILSNFVGFKEFLKDFKESEDKKTADSPRAEQPKNNPNNPENKILEYLEKKDKDFLATFDKNNMALEKILMSLKEQLEYTKKMLTMQEESTESKSVVDDLGSVSRDPVNKNWLLNGGSGPLKENTPSQEDISPKEDSDSWLETILKVAGASAGLGIVNKAVKGTANVVSKGIRATAKATTNMGSKALPKTGEKIVFDRSGKIVNKGPKPVSSEPPMEPKIQVPRPEKPGTSWLSKIGHGLEKLAPILKVVGPAALAYEGVQGIRNQEMTDAGVPWYARAAAGAGASIPAGIGWLGDVAANSVNKGINKLAGTNLKTDYDVGGEIYNGITGGVASAANAIKNDPTPNIDMSAYIEEFSQRPELTWDEFVKEKIKENPSLMPKAPELPPKVKLDSNYIGPKVLPRVQSDTNAKQNILDFLNKSNTNSTPQPAPAAAPIIMNGGSSVTNGGNVTNIITGGGNSLLSPQLAYRLGYSVN